MQYLREILDQVHGRSGVGMGGLAPLSFDTLVNWSRLNDTELSPMEVQALLYLDAILLTPERRHSETPAETVAKAKRVR